jgi:anhydro-N-acetylmuramic acid kinase
MKLSSQNSLIGIGLMSGTSCDGIDLVAAKFEQNSKGFRYNILDTRFLEYSQGLRDRLLKADELSGLELKVLDNELAILFSKEINSFKSGKTWEAQFVASHGHTVFHEPSLGYTMQIASGATIAALTRLPTVSDFRQGDVSLGGQGAPLVPIGDLLLFNEYDYCLNLGGFANISFKQNDIIIAFDICALNIVMNELAMKAGLSYDKGGELAKSGKIIDNLLEELNALPFFEAKAPKSLGREWVKANIFPILLKYKEHNSADLLCTFTEHAAQQIAKTISGKESTLLITGGGTKNDYLISCIKKKASTTQINHSETELIDFKEALIFAFLGFLRIQEIPNTIKGVTGANSDICAGAIYLP